MNHEEFYTTSEAAKVLGVSRISVFKKIKSGQINAQKFGRNYLIPQRNILEIAGEILSPQRRNKIESAVDKTIKDYGDVLRRLGRE